MHRIDLYIAALVFSTMYLVWRIVDMVILGAGLTLLGSASISGYITIALVVIASYCTGAILSAVSAYAATVLGGKERDTKQLVEQVPHLLILLAVSIGLSLVQALWYMHNGY
jgi:hypothetical protein